MGKEFAIKVLSSKEVTGFRGGVPFKLIVKEIQPAGVHLGRKLVAQWLGNEAAVAFLKMKAAAELAGIRLHVNSGWRSYEQQEKFWDAYMAWLDWWIKQPKTSRGRRKCRPAKPGRSNHHNGIAVDINRSHDDPDGAGPEIGLTDKWLAAHAKRFGFVRPYEREPWHWEYRP